MGSFGDDMHFEMEGIPPASRSQTSLEPSSLYTTRIDSQRSLTPPEGFFALNERLNNSMNFAWAESRAISLPEASLPCPNIYIDGSIMSLDRASAHNLSSFQQNNVTSSNQNELPVLDQPFNLRRQAQSSTRKRAPKASTMSAGNWKPHKDRIKEIYVSEGKSVKELREIMNKELGITATLRQYKLQIKQMKLEKNAKAKERKAIVKHVQHREHVIGKKSSYVRVRGHGISQEKLFRWTKDNLMDQPSMSRTPPSPLPSSISIYTNSICETLKERSPFILKHKRLVNGLTTASDMTSTLTQRLLNYAQSSKRMMESQEARAVFNDLQLILMNDYIAGKKRNEHHWNHAVREDIIQVRNLMNETQTLHVSDELNETRKLVPVTEIRYRDTSLSKVINRHAAWITPHGRVQASFWIVSNDSNAKTRGDATKTADKTVAARLAITPNVIGTSPFRVVFDFTPHLDPSATITYQAMIPNDSEVFRMADSGNVKELVELLKKGNASLTDRDEEGRSLINYAVSGLNVDMCKFLVDKEADVNAMEPDCYGYIGPVFSFSSHNDSETEEIERRKRAQCIRRVLEAGADISLESGGGDGNWETVFIVAVESGSFEVLKHMLDFGEPFIYQNGIHKSFWGECSVLTVLAHACGYVLADTIDVVDKAILLLSRKADISCRDEVGDTVLHTLLRCSRFHEIIPRKYAEGLLHHWDMSLEAPKDLLMVFITAGADVYATNDHDATPSMIALRYGREDEWIEALELCGYDSREVLASCIHHPTREHQKSKLFLQEYCQQRQHHGRFEGVGSEETDNDSQYSDGDAYEDDGHEEIRVVTESRDCFEGCDRNMEISGGVECTDSAMGIVLDSEDNGQTYEAEAAVNPQVPGLDDIADQNNEGMDVNFDDWIENGVDFMQSFTYDGVFSDTPFE